MAWLQRHVETLRIEVGPRVLWHVESTPRDLRWFRTIWERR